MLASRVTRKTRNANKIPPYMNRAMVSLTAPDVVTVQRALRSTQPRSTPMSPYAHCRLDQFRSPASTGLPDGRNTKFVTVDSFVADNITCVDTAGFMIRAFPILPYTAAITGLGSAAANSITVNGIALGNSNTYGEGLFPIGIPTEWPNGYNVGGNKDDPYFAATARLVSKTHRLIYTSPAVLASGIIAITPEKVGFQVYGVTTSVANPAAANTTSMIIKKPTDQTVSYIAPADTQILNCDCSVSNGLAQVYTRDTVTMRVENGAYIVSKHSGETFKIVPLVDQLYGLNASGGRVSSAPAGSTMTNYFTADSTLTTGGGVQWFDDDWESFNIIVTGITAGTTFRFETALCFEYGMTATSAFAPLAKRISDKDLATVVAVDKHINGIPVANPGTALTPGGAIKVPAGGR